MPLSPPSPWVSPSLTSTYIHTHTSSHPSPITYHLPSPALPTGTSRRSTRLEGPVRFRPGTPTPLPLGRSLPTGTSRRSTRGPKPTAQPPTAPHDAPSRRGGSAAYVGPIWPYLAISSPYLALSSPYLAPI